MQTVNRSRHDFVVVGGRVAGQASVCYGWPLHVIENAGHFMVVERPEAFLEAPRAALGNR
jgi:pimeloyl-ACP methyl ester carboxylesterase